MEDRSQFGLEEAITKWSCNLASTGIDYDHILELESHLRDEIDALHAGGLDHEEAFYVACRRLGKIDRLSQEYDKVGPRPIVVDSICSGVLMTLIAYGLSIFFVLFFIAVWPSLNMFEGGLLSCVGTVVVTIGMIKCLERNSNLHGQRSLAVLVIVFFLVKLGTYLVMESSPMHSPLGIRNIQNSVQLSCAGWILVFLLVLGFLIRKGRRKKAPELLVA